MMPITMPLRQRLCARLPSAFLSTRPAFARLNTSSFSAGGAPVDTSAPIPSTPSDLKVGRPDDAHFDAVPVGFTGVIREGTQLGDYPRVQHIPSQLRDPHKTYFDQQDRRNFNDPLPEQDEVLTFMSPEETSWPVTFRQVAAYALGSWTAILLTAFAYAKYTDAAYHKYLSPREMQE